MLDVISPFETPPVELRGSEAKVNGRAEIRFAKSGSETRLAHLYQHEPLRVLFPAPAGGDIPQAALVTTSGGLVGGDKMSIEIGADRGAAAIAIAQAAEKVYGSAGEDCVIGVDLRAEDGAWLEYLPQETILFDGARLNRGTKIDAHPTARVLAGEILVFGRIGRGERMNSGFVHDAWTVASGGRAVWADALHLDGDIGQALDHPAGLGGAIAVATAVYVGPDAADNLDHARGHFGETAGVIGGVSLVNGVLVARWIGEDQLALRNSFAKYWAGLRARIMGYPAALPRLWHV
ncbi:MAG: urease accessory protein UreD [Rhodospirillales bacterium]|jgi:urease accessory protein|nr:urease accessory protein [Rhodospirillaceae bacterium]MDP6428890.1 urease accessory protein UreD [Rhodospirillales bacterium]MDP6644737.1 urease accessory protein UreD [Rhodospirillales bacterium]MDP6840469.1 urease accessory protein UreD [Rhodospirillales bacterium]